MSPDHISQLILTYRYWVLIPLTFLEGPIVAFVAGTLAAVGYFNVYVLAILFFVRDVGLDGVYYAIGYWGGRTKFAQKMLTKMHITEEHMEDVRHLWERHPMRTMFFGKLSYGIASAFIVVAGTVKMNLRTFFAYGSIVAVAQYGGLLVLGYFFGASAGGSIEKILKNIEYVLAGSAVLLVGYYLFTFYLRGKFFTTTEKKPEEENKTE